MGGSASLSQLQLAIGRRFGTLSLSILYFHLLFNIFFYLCLLGIVTPNASLIVLDKLEQYLKHDIPPPPR